MRKRPAPTNRQTLNNDDKGGLLTVTNNLLTATNIATKYTSPTVALNPLDKASGYTLTNNNLTITNGTSAFTLNPNYKSAHITLSNGNLTGTGDGTGGDFQTRSIVARNTGKYYFEVTYNSTTNTAHDGIGLSNALEATNHWVGQTANSMGFYGNVSGSTSVDTNGSAITSAGPGTVQGDTVGVAVDLTTRRLWFRKNTGSFIVNGVTIDITVTTPSAFFDLSTLGTGPLFPSVSVEGTEQLTINLGATSFVGTLPSGFTAWNNASGGVTPACVRADTSASSGKFYFECTFTTTTSGYADGAGIANNVEDVANSLGSTSASVGVFGNGSSVSHVILNGASIGNASPITTGDIVGYAIDLVRGKLYVLAGFVTNGSYTWNNGDGSNPATNTGGYDISSVVPDNRIAYPAASLTHAASVATLNFGSTAFNHAPPSGFQPWNSAGIDQGVRGTVSKTSGKWYFETTIVSTANLSTLGIGLGNSLASLDTYLGGNGNIDGGGAPHGINSQGYFPSYRLNNQTQVIYGQGGRFSAGDLSTIGDTIGVAYDLDAGRCWFRRNNASFFLNSVLIDITVTTPTDWVPIYIIGPVYPMVSLQNGDVVTINFGTSAFVGTVPTGFKTFSSPPSQPVIPNPPQIFVVTADNQVVDGLIIHATGQQTGISCNGFDGVTIKNCIIYHEDGPGIQFSNSDNVLIQNNNIKKTNSPANGANAMVSNNIDGYLSNNALIGGSTSDKGNRVENGSSGVYLLQCNTATVSYLEGHNMRGPFPRGQLIQFNQSPGGILQHFSCVNDLAISWTEDNVNIYQSPNATVSDGFLDGNNSPSGDGVMVEQGSDNCTINGVDVIHWGNGAFGVSDAVGVVYTNCRFDLWHADGGRGAASSNGLPVASLGTGPNNTSFGSTNIYAHQGGTGGQIGFFLPNFTLFAPTGPQAFTPKSPLNLNVPHE